MLTHARYSGRVNPEHAPSAPHGSEARRRAAALFAQGVHRAEVARRVGISRATATNWYRIWDGQGARALAVPGRPGRRPKIDTARLHEVQHALARCPRELGYPLDAWTLDAVAALLHRVTGVSYHPRHVPRVLRRMGWVVPPVGASASHAFRQRAVRDPEGNVFHLREGHVTSGS